MARRAALSLSTGQKLRLAPELRMGMSYLAMPADQLAEEMRRAADENPALELRETQSLPSYSQGGSHFDLIDTVGARPTLGEHLRRQIGAQRAASQVQNAAFAITWSLDDKGYFDGTLEEIALTCDVSKETAERALALVQSCEPTGVGARDLRECLYLQLVSRGAPDEESRRALEALPDMLRNNWAQASAATGLAAVTLQHIATQLAELSPAPGAGFAQAAAPIVPDLIMEFDRAGAARVFLSKGALPDLRIAESALESAAQDADAKLFLQNHLASARNLQRAIEFRGATLLRIGGQIVRDQISFFRHGATRMHPLSRSALAEKLGLHPSTVGRAIAGKFMSHPGGTLPLSAFFPSQPSQGGPSSFAIQHRIAELVAAEHASDVLSDEAIAAQLLREGVDIARRTVAKYRGRLNIPPSHIRKRLKEQRSVRRGDGTKGLMSQKPAS